MLELDLSAATPALTGLRSLVATLALATGPVASASLPVAPLPAGGGQGAQAAVPDCIRQCTPHVTENGIAWECEVVCVIDSTVLVFDITNGNGGSSMPRFASPSGCTPSCPFGDEALKFTAGDVVTLQAGLWGVPGGGWIAGPGSISAVEISIVPLVDALVQSDFDALAWTPLGSASLESSGFWELPWTTHTFDDPAGYLLRADMFDSATGTVTAITVARDPDGCGHHGFGEFPIGVSPGANTMKLVASGGDCPGATLEVRTERVPGSGAFTLVSTGGLDLPIQGGRLWIDPLGIVATEFETASGGVVTEKFTIPSNAALVGVSVFFQALALDPQEEWAFSNGSRLTICACG